MVRANMSQLTTAQSAAMATTTTDDGFHEIQLNGKQLVFLFMAVTVVSVVIFLMGVLVGRGVRAERAVQTAEASESPTDDIDKAPPIPTGTSQTGAPATANETLSYSQQLDAKKPSDAFEPGRPRPTTAPAPVAVPPSREAANTPKEAAAPPAPAPTPPPAAPAPAQAPTAAPAAVSAEPAGPGFAIQVAALREREEADSVVRRLVDKGYSAYVVSTASGTPAVYRVRVGKFKERREADSVAARLQKEEKFKPWVVR